MASACGVVGWIGMSTTLASGPGIHWTPLSSERARAVLAATGRVLRDSNRTLDILLVEEVTSQAQLAHLLQCGTFDTDEGRTLMRERPHLADLDPDMLRTLPDGSLGREWVRFLDEHGLSLAITRQPTPHTPDDACAYVLHRIRQSHDLWHTLLGLGVAGHEEVLVHAFSLAQTGLPSSVAIVSLGSLKHMVLEGRWECLRRELWRAYRIGRQARPLLAVCWERHLHEPLDDVRRWLNVTPLRA
jgi:ubiquinone biosynthesis protein COQ4